MHRDSARLKTLRDALRKITDRPWPACPDGDPTSCEHEACNYVLAVSLLAHLALEDDARTRTGAITTDLEV